MDEATKTEVAPQEQVSAAPVAEAVQEIKEETSVQTESQDPNWLKNLRKERQKLVQENRLKDELISQLMQAKQATPPVQAEDDLIESIQKEEYVPGEKVAKGFKHLEQKFAKKLEEVENKYKASAYQTQINDLRREFSDLEDVVNPETLQIVKEKNPRLAQTWAGLDDYTLYVQAYPYIKHSGILEEVPGFKRAKEVDKKLEQNRKSPPSPLANEKRPIAQAFDFNRLSDVQKKELQKEMYHYASLGGGAY